MSRPRLVLAAIAAAAAAAAIGVTVAVGGSGSSGDPSKQLLPDLETSLPSAIAVRTVEVDGKPGYRLGFASVANNVGAGPLEVIGNRAGLEQETMDAAQVIHGRDGGRTTIQGVGEFHYNVDPTHEHWHLLPFMSYELRTSKGFKLVRPDVKTGFCLGDRRPAPVAARLTDVPPQPVYNTNCGIGATDLLGLVEGISVGWGDIYEAWRDGQEIDITGLAAGRYVLVHRVNADRELRESSYGNNASSVLLQLSWPTGKQGLPQVRVLASCPDKARCALPKTG